MSQATSSERCENVNFGSWNQISSNFFELAPPVRVVSVPVSKTPGGAGSRTRDVPGVPCLPEKCRNHGEITQDTHSHSH